MGWPNFPRLYVQVTESGFRIEDLDSGIFRQKTFPQGLAAKQIQKQKLLLKTTREVSKLAWIFRPKLVLHWIGAGPADGEDFRNLGLKSGARELVICTEISMGSDDLLNRIPWCNPRPLRMR